MNRITRKASNARADGRTGQRRAGLVADNRPSERTQNSAAARISRCPITHVGVVRASGHGPYHS